MHGGNRRARKLHTVHAFACWLNAEDPRHEVPRRGVFGTPSYRRSPPHLVSVPDIRKLLTAALSVEPVDTIAPLTWHYMFGLVASTGLRIGEAMALELDDITADGLIIRDTKFRKTRMVALATAGVLVAGEKPEAGRNLGRIEKLAGQGNHAVEPSPGRPRADVFTRVCSVGYLAQIRQNTRKSLHGWTVNLNKATFADRVGTQTSNHESNFATTTTGSETAAKGGVERRLLRQSSLTTRAGFKRTIRPC